MITSGNENPPRNGNMSVSSTETCQVAIVGSGPVGASIAEICVNAGLDVILIEGGEPPDKDRMEVIRRVKDNSVPWTFPRWRYESDGDDVDLNEFAVRKLGGSSLAWGAITPRFLENDFRLNSRYGVARDWPFDYTEIEPYYVAAERFMGVAGSDNDPFNGPRSAPFPMPPFPKSKTDRFVEKACQQLDIQLHSVPMARNSIEYQGRQRCVNYGICRACPIHAMYGSDWTLAQLETKPNFRLFTGVCARRILADGGQARVLSCIDRDHKQRHIEAEKIFLCCQGVENVRLVLLSDLLTNTPSLGRGLMEHPKFYMTGTVKEKLDPHQRGYESATTLQFHDHPSRGNYSGARLLIRENAGPTPSKIVEQSGLWGEALREEIQNLFGRQIVLGAFLEQLPYEENQITLSRSVRDEWGDPGARIQFHLMHKYERQGVKKMTSIIKKIYGKMGATGVRRIMNPTLSGHYMGCHRMGTDLTDSVTDPNLETHEIKNLFLVGGGSFPTAGISNPTLTSVAIAMRAAQKVCEEMASKLVTRES